MSAETIHRACYTISLLCFLGTLLLGAPLKNIVIGAAFPILIGINMLVFVRKPKG